MYDYNRKDKNGNTRELHIEKGVKAANCNESKPREIPVCSDGTRLLGNCEYFAVKELKLTSKKELFVDEESYQALMVVDGSAELETEDNTITIEKGETVFLPAGLGVYTLNGSATVLLTTHQLAWAE